MRGRIFYAANLILFSLLKKFFLKKMLASAEKYQKNIEKTPGTVVASGAIALWRCVHAAPEH